MEFKNLEKAMQFYKDKNAPMANIKVVYKGEVVYEKELNENSKFDTPFYMYSASKVITAVAAMQLVEKGVLDLDEDVSKYIPSFENVYVGKEKKLSKTPQTLRYLLSMQSGYGYNFDKENLKKAVLNKNATTLQVVAEMLKDYVNFEPGTDFDYGFGLDIVGGIIEAVTGISFDEYVKKNIFEPLGMKNSTFKLSDVGEEKNIWQQYRFNEKTNGYDKADNNIFVLTDNFYSGGAGLISTTNDYIKFVKVMANNGLADDGFRLITKQSIDEMKKPQLCEKAYKTFWKGPDYSYGLGVRTLIKNDNLRVPLGEFGWDSAGNSYVLIDTENNLGIFFGCLVLGWNKGYENHAKIRDAVYEDLGL